MSQPKRRHSKTRGRLRRSGRKVAGPTMIRCPECGAPIEPHTACRKCGAYGSRRSAIKTRVKKAKA